MSLAQEYELLRRVPFFAEIEPAKLKLHVAASNDPANAFVEYAMS